jgi:hypothetical protein
MEHHIMSLVEKAHELLDRVAALDGQPGKAASETLLELQKVVIDLRLLYRAPRSAAGEPGR